MAVHVLLSFEDEELAKEFVAANVPGSPTDNINFAAHLDGARVCGVWKRPSVFCECPGGIGKQEGYTRGRKYGWWVHNKCGKPSKVKISASPWEIALGTNLLPPELSPEPFDQRLKNWNSPVEWRDLLPASAEEEHSSPA